MIDVTLMFAAPTGASTARNAWVPGLPTAVIVTISYRSVDLATVGYVAP